MKVILQQDVKGQGKKGEMIEVSECHGGRHQHHEPEREGPQGRGSPAEG